MILSPACREWGSVKIETTNQLGVKLIFEIKYNAEGVAYYEEKLVAKGYLQKYGQIYDATFASVIKYSILWVLLYLDVKTAFLYGNVAEDLYMDWPPGFVGPEGETLGV